MTDIIAGLRAELNNFIDNEIQTIGENQKLISKSIDCIKAIEESWQGAWIQNDYNFYALDGENITTANFDCLLDLIVKYRSVDLKQTDSDINTITTKLKYFNNTLAAELSWIRDNPKFNNEENLLNRLENFVWGASYNDAIDKLTPSIVKADSTYWHNNYLIPPHIEVFGYYMYQQTKCQSCYDFVELVKKILRQIEIKQNIKAPSSSVDILQTIFNNFHQFAMALRNRHSDRETIVIKDEYDVQDLLYAILKIHFRDVRSEEHTPSYAGKSTRMDFLLKSEKTVIEIKKTRDGLKDAEIGSQLIIDKAHYCNHPDCEILYCFIYDPENLVKNPVGLENDLSESPNEGMHVKIFIKP